MEKLGQLRLRGKAWLAPMAGVSDVAFRSLCRMHGAAATPTEFLSANAIAREEPKVIELTKVADNEHPKIIQIFGQNVNNIAKAVEWIDKDGRFDCVDMNIGCPSPKVLLQGAGSALLRRPHLIKDIINGMTKTTNMPISIKIRTGMDESRKNGLEICQLAEDCGVNHVAIHGRTVKQGYSGKSDWEFIKKAVDTLNVPVIANGDITDGKSAKECLEQTNAAGVMVGRAARGNPFVFTDINATLDGEEYTKPSAEKKAKAFFQYLDLYKKHQLNNFGELKGHAMQFTRGVPGSAALRAEIAKIQDVQTMQEKIDEALS